MVALAFPVYGDEPETACATGFHFASLWEIADPSNLLYDRTQPNEVTGQPPFDTYGWDIGSGPPTELGG